MDGWKKHLKEMRDNSSIIQLRSPLNYYRLISGSDHLHFGFWPDGDAELPFEEALQKMFDQLTSSLPAPPAKILDVGCGLGLSAYLLGSRGYSVTAIDPSAELIDYAIKQYGNDSVDFRVADYFDNNESIFTEGSYDGLLFQESLRFLIPLKGVMEKARRLLREKGVIIIGDEVCYDIRIKPSATVHMSPEVYVSLAESGFRIIKNKKMGKNAIRTYEVVTDRLAELLNRSVSAPKNPDVESDLIRFLDGWKKHKLWHEKGQFGYEIFVGKKDPYFIRSYMEDDEHTILPMFREIFRADRTLDHWHWKFRDNPFGSHKICMGFSQAGDMVSHFAGYPVSFCSTIEDIPGPRTFPAIHAGDTMTHPSVRRIGLGKTGLLARTTYYFYAKICEGFSPFIYGFNTANIKKLGERYLGYTYIEAVPFWIKDMSQSSFKRPGIFSSLFSRFTVEEVFCVDDEWDAFFDCVVSTYKFLVKRDAAYIRWRYLECPDRVHRVFAIRKRGELAGWGVFVRKNDTLLWGDALFEKKCPEAASYLLNYLINKCFSSVKTVEAWFSKKPEWWSNYIKSIGFDAHEEPNGLTLGYVPYWNNILDNDALDYKFKNRLYYTWGDSDLF